MPRILNAILAKLPGQPFGEGPPVVPVLRLTGVIAASTGPFRAGTLSLASLAGRIDRAFKMPGAKAVALVVNSPGGSPAQSALIADRIRQLAAEKRLPVVAFVEDVAASGGYWLACAADEIFAGANSIVGSIGVISSGFGFHQLLERIGIERRLHMQGDRKSLLDPFRPERPEDVARLERLQQEIHANFIAYVQARRGGKLVESTEAGIFAGEIFLGQDGLRHGLIDGIGDVRSVMRQRYGEDVMLPVLGGQVGWLRRKLGLARDTTDIGSIVGQAMEMLEQRALWARFGL